MDNPSAAPDVAQVLKHNRILLYRHIATRLALAGGLCAVPYVAHLAGYDAALPAFAIPPAAFVLIFLMLRLRHGARLKVCEKVLRTYPLEYRTRVSRKGSQWMYLGTVHTVRLSVRGQHGARSLRALSASTVRRWPEDAEEGGAWFAGDPAFGGVMILAVLACQAIEPRHESPHRRGPSRRQRVADRGATQSCSPSPWAFSA